MSILHISQFGGVVPRSTKRGLPDTAAQIAENLLADTDEFRPLNQDSTSAAVGTVTADQTVKTMYRYPTASSTIIGSPLSLSLVKSPIVDDQYDRVYASIVHGETEYPPQVMSSGVNFPNAALRPLGVPYPKALLVLTQATVSDTFMTPSEVTAFGESIVARIRSICSTALEQVLWNPAFNIGSNAAFREYPSDTGVGIWQRRWTNTSYTAPPTWNTHNGTDVDRHLWTIELANPAFVIEGANQVFYANFPAKARTWKVKADVSVQTAALQALVIPNTSDRVLSDAEITLLFTTLRAVLPDDPISTSSTDLLTLLGRYKSEFLKLVNFLDQGFSTDITPQIGFQMVSRSMAELQGSVDGIATFYDGIATSGFDNALLGYFRDVKFPDKLPTGEMEFVEVRYYTYTFVNDRGEESKPYLPGDGNSDTDLPFIECNQIQAALVTRAGGDLAHTSAVDNITHWRVYRSAASAEKASFQFVAEVPIGTTSFSDIRRTDSLNESLPSTTHFPPPVHSGARYLKHLVAMPGDFLAGYIDNTVYFSEPGKPYAWPPLYAIPCESKITGLGVFGATLVVLTEGRPNYISGSSPLTMSKVPMESTETCISPRSIVPVTGGVVFASKNGLCIASQSGIANMTQALFTQKEWEAIGLTTLVCAELNGVVYMTQPTLGTVAALHIPTGKLVGMNISLTAFYSDFYNGKLYAALPPASGQIARYVELLNGSGVRTARWRSKRITMPKPASLAWLVAQGEQSEAAPLNIDLYGYQINPATGLEVQTKIQTATGNGTYSAVLTNTRPVRMQPGLYEDFEIILYGTCRVSRVSAASTVEEIKEIV